MGIDVVVRFAASAAGAELAKITSTLRLASSAPSA
jgi:hypothetical protein